MEKNQYSAKTRLTCKRLSDSQSDVTKSGT